MGGSTCVQDGTRAAEISGNTGACAPGAQIGRSSRQQPADGDGGDVSSRAPGTGFPIFCADRGGAPEPAAEPRREPASGVAAHGRTAKSAPARKTCSSCRSRRHGLSGRGPPHWRARAGQARPSADRHRNHLDLSWRPASQAMLLDNRRQRIRCVPAMEAVWRSGTATSRRTRRFRSAAGESAQGDVHGERPVSRVIVTLTACPSRAAASGWTAPRCPALRPARTDLEAGRVPGSMGVGDNVALLTATALWHTAGYRIRSRPRPGAGRWRAEPCDDRRRDAVRKIEPWPWPVAGPVRWARPAPEPPPGWLPPRRIARRVCEAAVRWVCAAAV